MSPSEAAATFFDSALQQFQADPRFRRRLMREAFERSGTEEAIARYDAETERLRSRIAFERRRFLAERRMSA